MYLLTTLKQMTDRARPDDDAQAILDAAEHDSELDSALKCMEDTAENREWIATNFPDVATNIERL